MEALASEGERYFYDGPLGASLTEVCRAHGVQVTREDLLAYRVERREPLERRYKRARIVTNPPPSSGGILIAFALALLADRDLTGLRFGGSAHLDLLASVMELTNRARVEAGLQDSFDNASDQASGPLLDPELLERYERQVRGQPLSTRGTTHMSVVDAHGNMAALTLSNGACCGYVLRDSGIMMNNMLGEEDLNPRGFHRWTKDRRISSMMAPSLAFRGDGSAAALGSGGSNRIRTAILQVLLNLIDFDLPVDQAVDAPRLHFERGVANLESGFDQSAVDRLAGQVDQLVAWPGHNLFFGGVHAVTRQSDGRLAAAGDDRRGGVARTV